VVRTSELRARELVNVDDGRRLGTISDLDIDVANGRVTALVVPAGGGRLFGLFGREEETVVAWERIVRVGVDVILVSLAGDATADRADPRGDAVPGRERGTRWRRREA
jgi:YlmC/YmxH family sporulation protein